jgi:hypothetical protein
MKTFRTYFNSKAAKTIANIIKTEELGVNVSYKTSTLGDDLIVVTGDKEEVEILKDIFEMVK